MTTMPRELARKQSAEVTVQQQDNGRTLDGRYRATRGGPNGWTVFLIFMTVLMGAGLAGLLLSLQTL